MNRFSYEWVQIAGSGYYKWKIKLTNGQVIQGSAATVRQAHRKAKRAYKQHLRMERLLNNDNS